MSNTDLLTTAQLRSLAYDAQESGDYLKAAELYESALAAYPDQNGALADADKHALASHARRNRMMAATA